MDSAFRQKPFVTSSKNWTVVLMNRHNEHMVHRIKCVDATSASDRHHGGSNFPAEQPAIGYASNQDEL
jgi:hypothetical protein